MLLSGSLRQCYDVAEVSGSFQLGPSSSTTANQGSLRYQEELSFNLKRVVDSISRMCLCDHCMYFGLSCEAPVPSPDNIERGRAAGVRNALCVYSLPAFTSHAGNAVTPGLVINQTSTFTCHQTAARPTGTWGATPDRKISSREFGPVSRVLCRLSTTTGCADTVIVMCIFTLHALRRIHCTNAA